MKSISLVSALGYNPYPGRGILLGRSEDGKKAVIAYFIMGRSENSTNRIFVEEGQGIRTEAFDPAKLVDPSLVIYAPVRVFEDTTIVTNGDQTDTIYDYLSQGKTFADALRTRTFEPDEPNYTPRISGVMQGFQYKLSILKSATGDPTSVRRYFFEYDTPIAGQGHLLHTYNYNGDPLPSFEGEPVQVTISGNIDDFTELLWNNLSSVTRVSLFTRFIDVETGETETRIINRNQK
jgi:IMP cyclohydrolase